MDFPLWFGPADRSLFAMASMPDDGSASGAVVLCAPIGLEGVCARQTFATLGHALADVGILAFRFDYDGTGDSVGGSEDPDRVAAWLRGVHHAVSLAHRSGVSKVAVVGMRLGATFAAAALSDEGEGWDGDPVDGLVLWDPCPSGRSYLRAQRALQFFGVGQSDHGDGSVEAPGVVFDADTVAALSAIDIGALRGQLARRILLLARKTPSTGTGVLERFCAARPVERGTAHGQERLVDVEPFAAEIPHADVEVVTRWLADTLTGERVPLSVPRRQDAIVGVGEAGSIVERPMSLGPIGLFGMVTEPQEVSPGGRGTGPTALFLNAGVIDHVGPARLWVDLGRRWAAQGMRSVRCDLSGLGNSPPRPGQPDDEVYMPEAIEDVLDVASAVSPDDPADVVLVGLCSGGYHAIEAALVLGARGVCRGESGVPPQAGGTPRGGRSADQRDRPTPQGRTGPQAMGPVTAGTRPARRNARTHARPGVVAGESSRGRALPGAGAAQARRLGRADLDRERRPRSPGDLEGRRQTTPVSRSLRRVPQCGRPRHRPRAVQERCSATGELDPH